jgi:hypothetical protein
MAMQCKAKTRTGARCTAYAVSDSQYCFTHAPERARERAQAHRRGGCNRIAPKVGKWQGRIKTIDDALTFLNDLVIPDLIALENTVTRARALIAAIETAIKAIDAGEVERRLTALENLVNGRGDETKGRDEAQTA